MKISHFTELNVYQASRKTAHQIYLLSQTWPQEEKYSLTDQIRRAARSAGANIAESWGKQRYEAHFLSKLTDADAENHEIEHWLICARDSGYLSDQKFAELVMAKQETGRMLGAMLQKPDSFLLRPTEIS